MAKSRTEQLADIDAKMKQLAERKKKLENAEKERMRRERTHRLIEIGAVVESVLGVIEKDQLSQLQRDLESLKKAREGRQQNGTP